MFHGKKLLISSIFLLSSCGNPGGISDEGYDEYKQLGPPKILYSCINTARMTKPGECMQAILDNTPLPSKCKSKETKEEAHISYVAGVGAMATYNKLLADSRTACESKVNTSDFKSHRKFVVLESEK